LPENSAIDPCDALERTLRSAGPEAALNQLVDVLDQAGEYRSLLDALLLKARRELGLPLIATSNPSTLPEPARSRFEERYVEAIRLVGSRFLDRGEIPTAWAYFRAIAEPGPVAVALECYEPEDGEKLGQVIDVALHQGAHPIRGFELILAHYGTCAAITALEQVPSNDSAVQVACIERLIRHLHGQLAANLRADIQQRGESVDPTSSISTLIADRDWLFADEAYHTDISHLSATVRYAIVVTEPAVLALAVELADYGRRLSPRLQFEGAPPFERTFDDHLIFFRALLGDEQNAAVAHFRDKLETTSADDSAGALPARVLVDLLARIGRLDEAIDLASSQLAHLPEASLGCPGIAELCARAGRMDRLATIARQQENLVNFLAARLQESS
jgi:hypothetical protein